MHTWVTGLNGRARSTFSKTSAAKRTAEMTTAATERRRRKARDIARIRGAKRVAGGYAFGRPGPAVGDCDEQQNVDRNYAVINLEAYARANARARMQTRAQGDARIHRGGAGRLHRWLGIFVFSGWHRPAFTRLHAPPGCVICMFAVTEENLNQLHLYLSLPRSRSMSPLYDAHPLRAHPSAPSIGIEF